MPVEVVQREGGAKPVMETLINLLPFDDKQGVKLSPLQNPLHTLQWIGGRKHGDRAAVVQYLEMKDGKHSCSRTHSIYHDEKLYTQKLLGG